MWNRDDYDNHIAGLEEKIEELEKEAGKVEGLEDQILGLQEQVSDLGKTVEEQQTQLSGADSTNAALCREAEAREGHIKRMSNEFDKQVEELDKKIEHLEAKRTEALDVVQALLKVIERRPEEADLFERLDARTHVQDAYRLLHEVGLELSQESYAALAKGVPA